MVRIKRTITILVAHEKWLKERKIKLSRFVQKAINDKIKEELYKKEMH